MADEEDDPQWGLRFLTQLDYILESDPFIDELGFVHPSQLASLHSLEKSISLDGSKPFFIKMKRKPKGQEAVAEPLQQSEDCSQRNEGQEMDAKSGANNWDGDVSNGVSSSEIPYEKSAFWCAHHKLAIAMPTLMPLYKAAKAAFVVHRKDYTDFLKETGVAKECLSFSQEKQTGGTVGLEMVKRNGQTMEQTWEGRKAALEEKLMRFTRALIIVNCDFATAWNLRKLILSSLASSESSLIAELRLASMVLSYGSKSEETWAHRRWVINRMVADGVNFKTLDCILEGDSKLVELIAGRSTMNYRAWRHRCWLLSRMSLSQVLAELQKSKLWAESHVADNCCFHYRRCLLLRLLQAKAVPIGELEKGAASLCSAGSEDLQSLARLWKEELCWNEELIKRYIGREALWVHRRFLLRGLSHCKLLQPDSRPTSVTKRAYEQEHLEEAMELARKELQFADFCMTVCNSDLIGDATSQCEFAAAYKLWIFSLRLHHVPEKGIDKNGTSATVSDSMQRLLNDICPSRQHLWDGLVPNLL